MGRSTNQYIRLANLPNPPIGPIEPFPAVANRSQCLPSQGKIGPACKQNGVNRGSTAPRSFVFFRLAAISGACSVIVARATLPRCWNTFSACIFWLKNRRPDLWRDVTRQQQTGRDGGPIKITASARDAVIERIKALASRLLESETEAEAPFVRGKRHRAPAASNG